MKKLISISFALLLIISLLSFTACSYECATCKDKSKITCTNCDGEKEISCTICGGDGVATCTLCAGVGTRTCTLCAGLGGRYQYNYITKMYSFNPCICAGGRTTCATTSPCACGDGRLSCGICDENAQIECPDCSGNVD